MAETFTFHVKINDGAEQTITTRSSVYREAVAACPAIFGLDLPAKVEIWVPNIKDDPLTFAICDDEYGHLVVGIWDRQKPFPVERMER